MKTLINQIANVLLVQGPLKPVANDQEILIDLTLFIQFLNDLQVIGRGGFYLGP
jgi:hypothetical protein